MKKIVAIGGGEIRTKGTLAIDQEILRLSRKKKPRLLFIPTGSADSENYWEHIQEYFGDHLGCTTDVLFLLKEAPSETEIKRKILSSDIIYVGGGNTLMMMRLWRRLGVAHILNAAYDKGIVLCGISAGSVCWFDSGHSDAMSFYNPKKWNYINVRGLGLIKGFHCPHYNSRTRGVPRRKDFQKMIARIGGFGIAIEDNCAIEFLDGKHYRIISSKPRAGAYRIYKTRGEVVSEKIKPETALMPIAELYQKKPNPASNPKRPIQ